MKQKNLVNKLFRFAYLLTNNWSLQVLNDDEVSGSCLQFAILYTRLYIVITQNTNSSSLTHNELSESH